jgi:hypothetical protein
LVLAQPTAPNECGHTLLHPTSVVTVSYVSISSGMLDRSTNSLHQKSASLWMIAFTWTAWKSKNQQVSYLLSKMQRWIGGEPSKAFSGKAITSDHLLN